MLRAWPHLAAAAAGALYALGFPGVGLWPLSLVFAWPLWWLLDGSHFGFGRALSVGLVFGFVTQSVGYYWLPQTLERFAAMPWPAALGVSALLFVYQAGQLALFFIACWRAREVGWEVLMVAPLALAAVELVYPLLFPSYLANSAHLLWPVMQLAWLGGPTLVSFAWLSLSAALYAIAVRRPRRLSWRPRAVAAVLALMTLAIGFGLLRGHALEAEIAAAETRTLGLVQANLGHRAKREDPERVLASHVELSRTLLREHTVDLLVWPETVLLKPLPRGAVDLRARVPRLGVPLLTGALAWGEHRGAPSLTNSAVLANADGRVVGRYDKVRRVPFVEYMPFVDVLPVLRRLSPATGRFTAGYDLSPLKWAGDRIAVLICYEDVLPGFVRQVMRAADPHLLVNLTNDAWFGDTTQPFIHLALAKLRAVEQDRYLVRATNSGVSAVIDPLGRAVMQTASFQRTTRVVQVALLSGSTPYRALGDWPGLLGLIALPLLARRRKGAQGAEGRLSPPAPNGLR